jgi:hypothetical protein
MSMVSESQIPTSGVAVELSPGGMIPEFEYEILPARYMGTPSPQVRTAGANVLNRLRRL